MQTSPDNGQTSPSMFSSERSSSNGLHSENSWLFYTRLLGTVTVVCVAIATLLHQIWCELSTEPTHWLAACFLVALSVVGLILIQLVSRIATRVTVWMSGGLAIVSGAMPWLVPSCDTHGVYFAGLCLLFLTLYRVLSVFGYDSSYAT